MQGQFFNFFMASYTQFYICSHALKVSEPTETNLFKKKSFKSHISLCTVLLCSLKQVSLSTYLSGIFSLEQFWRLLTFYIVEMIQNIAWTEYCTKMHQSALLASLLSGGRFQELGTERRKWRTPIIFKTFFPQKWSNIYTEL